MKSDLVLAVPKGTLYKPTVALLKEAGFSCSDMETDTRKLLFTDEEQKVKYIVCRPTDIPTFVEYGAADLGFVGKDTIVEQKKEVFELLDLKYGFCRFVVAMPEEAALEKDWDQLNHVRVATKFPRVAEEFFMSRGKQMEIIKLHGNIELAPMVGLSDLIVDIVSTGRTLRDNKLVEVARIFNSTTRLIANRVSHRMLNSRINPIVRKIREIVENGGMPE
ncbi:ATP phosphoribosyltransferase [Phosphitispora fastidiosa]|uniref:ATP phosphoribosyltransferase n=1 Tax=Phosphitispora fastidiosa TaxID=2837202 RepID=UPI001E42742E|nr:ATP phosphoribosyltransferase [Phosphitispora fastidiosa]MBU7008530.1 ATP phosphoribosyltransferase [Phosphitispora fastidiosa]